MQRLGIEPGISCIVGERLTTELLSLVKKVAKILVVKSHIDIRISEFCVHTAFVAFVAFLGFFGYFDL